MTAKYLLNRMPLVDRRSALRGAAAVAGASLLPVKRLWAEDEGCGIITQILIEAEASVIDAVSWQLNLDPLAVQRARSAVTDMQANINTLRGEIDNNRRLQLLNYADAVGSTLLLLSGVFIGLGPALIASVVFSGTMLVAKTVSYPVAPGGTDVLLNISGSRLPHVIEAFGEGAGAISRNAAAYGRVAGNVTGAVFVLYGFYGFARSTDRFQASTIEVGRLQEALAGLENDLGKLETHVALVEMRRACAQAVADDLRAVSGESCAGNLP